MTEETSREQKDKTGMLILDVHDERGDPWSQLRVAMTDAADELIAEGRTDDQGHCELELNETQVERLTQADKLILHLFDEEDAIYRKTVDVKQEEAGQPWRAAIVVGRDGEAEQQVAQARTRARAVDTAATPAHTAPKREVLVIEVPDFVGKTVAEAQKLADKYGLDIVLGAVPHGAEEQYIVEHQDAAAGVCQPQDERIFLTAQSTMRDSATVHGSLCVCEALDPDLCSGENGKVKYRKFRKTPLHKQEVTVYRPGTTDACCTATVKPKGRFGKFQCTVPSGTWEIALPEVDGYTTTTPGLSRIQVHLAPGEQVRLAPVCYVARGGRVTGTVFLDREENGQLAKNPRLREQTLTLRALRDGKEYVAQSDGQGVFNVDSLPRGYYRLQLASNVYVQPYGALQLSTAGTPLSKPFYVGPGSTHRRDIPYIVASGEVEGLVYYDGDGSGRQFGGEPGIDGVPVLLISQQTSETLNATTDLGGYYFFKGVAPGRYWVVFTEQIMAAPAGGNQQALMLSTRPQVEVNVKAGRRVTIPATGYGPERHVVSGKVLVKDGDKEVGGAGYLVRITDGSGNIYQTVTDVDGEYSYEFADAPGEIQLTYFAPTEDNLTDFENQPLATRGAYVNQPFRVTDVLVHLPRNGSAVNGARRDRGRRTFPRDDGLQDAVVDIASYMPTSTEVGGGWGSGSSAGTSQSLQQSVDRAMTEVLGRKLKEDDPKAFLAALERSFTIDEKDEARQIKWTPRLYAIQTELGGAITGAQASLYHRAKSAVDDALPLLDGLEPLVPDPDQEEVTAVRAIVRTEMAELVNELGLEGGPRVQRVDRILTLLQSELERLADVFGLDETKVITVAEEEVLTNYLVVRDYIDSMTQTWNNFRPQFLGVGSSFLGTQLVLLQRALSVVVESVEEAYRAMDAVNLGPSERQTVYITIEGSDSLTVEELLSWVSRFARDEAPALVLEGGRRGVAAIAPVAGELVDLVAASVEADTGNVGFSRPRVRRALLELRGQLNYVETLCQQLLPGG